MTTSWAVVTGASSGLGEAYARHLAAQGANVVLVARSEDKLFNVSVDLERTHGVQTLVLPFDLTDPADRFELLGRLDHLEVHTLVNNAGFASHGELADLERDRIASEVQLNVAAVTELTHAVLPQMLSRDLGAIINVASTAAFQPIPEMATYAATKAFVLSFSNALWAETRRTGVRVVCICPGPTETSFWSNAGAEQNMTRRRSVDDVVATTFAGLRQRKPYVVDGVANRLLAHANRFVPTRVALRLANWVVTH
ncbi:SDR family oxidoreductase [Tessaracoccus rhinocerotis]|uniref:SDR family oxidoreductase n=1 Tax=Tessaracoccus rhinocerotis TaxID=1689449 RepID=A0A553K1L3_9ACTN|nr:SDR family oxidoreductase [Tessaracoccus rhinocerotis]TRY18592.1 SDR family oxidoreductase [Tessaracoccus rhinocerotis]